MTPKPLDLDSRFHMMDPASLGAMSYDTPASDGSSCRLMADSLRLLLRLEFDAVLDAHAGRMTREAFYSHIFFYHNLNILNKIYDKHTKV